MIFLHTYEEAVNEFHEKSATTIFVFTMLLTVTPIKDYLIAMAFSWMYYSQGIKTTDTRVLNEKEKERLLFATLRSQMLAGSKGTGASINQIDEEENENHESLENHLTSDYRKDDEEEKETSLHK